MNPSFAVGTQFVEEAARRGWVRHALKTALAVCLAVVAAMSLPLDFAVLVPVFAFLLMTFCMPDVLRNWLQTLPALVVSAAGTAAIVTLFLEAPLLFLAVMLAWIFALMLFANWYPVPATLGTRMSAICTFVAVFSSGQAALQFLQAYLVAWVLAGAIAASLQTVIWHRNVRRLILRRFGAVYAHLEEGCRELAHGLRTGAAPAEAGPEDWAIFRPLRKLLSPDPRRPPVLADRLVRMARRCRAMNVRVAFLRRNLPPALGPLPADLRSALAGILEPAADHFRTLTAAALDPAEVRPVDAALLEQGRALAGRLQVPGESPGLPADNLLLQHGLFLRILTFLVDDLAATTALHNAVIGALRGRGRSASVPLPAPLPSPPVPLVNAESIRRSTKMVVLMVLLVGEQLFLGTPGGTQVAFFATFFASVGNLGRQARVEMVGLAGLAAGIAYGFVAALVTARAPHLLLGVAFIALGSFAAAYFFQASPRFGVAGMQAGLALAYAYLALPGPEWGTFADARTRLAALLVAGTTALAVHAFLWPVLPIRRLRASIAAALRETATFLEQRLRPQPGGAALAPPDLGAVAAEAGELLDDARFLPGSDKAHPLDHELILHLLEIDSNLEYLQFLLQADFDSGVIERFYRELRDPAGQVRRLLDAAAAELDRRPGRGVGTEPVSLVPDIRSRFEALAQEIGPPSPGVSRQLDRLAAVAPCLENMARAARSIARDARTIDQDQYR